MKHATQRALDELTELLERIRACPGLRERSRGVFYRGSSSFVHFHEDPAGLFGDVNVDGDWQRFPVNRTSERGLFARKVAAITAATTRDRGKGRVATRGR